MSILRYAPPKEKRCPLCLKYKDEPVQLGCPSCLHNIAAAKAKAAKKPVGRPPKYPARKLNPRV